MADASTTSGAGDAGDKASLFAEIGKIDQSSGRTAGLRHVTKDMKAGGSAAAASSEAPKPAPKAAAPKAKAASSKPKAAPIKRKMGLRWVVENFSKDDGVVTLDDVTIKEEVYIGGCTDATIILPAKCKAIAIDGCKKTQVLFEGAVSSCELVNCQRVKIQCKVFVPTISIDKVDGITVYVSHEGRKTQFATSKSSEMNVCFPESDAEDAEMVEQPIPEQFIATITASNTVDITVSELYTS